MSDTFASDVKTKISRVNALSIIDEIVAPYYQKFLKDNEIAMFFITEHMLHELKMKQSVFALKFFSQDFEALKIEILNNNQTYKHISLGNSFLILNIIHWMELTNEWIVKHLNVTPTTLLQWQHKMMRVFTYTVSSYIGFKDGIVNPFSMFENMRLPNEISFAAQQHQVVAQPTLNAPIERSAQSYIAEIGVDHEILQEITELEESISGAIYQGSFVDEELLEYAYKFFRQYSKMLNMLIEFKDLGFALTTLADFIKTINCASLTKEQATLIIKFLDSIVEDLSSFKKYVFIEQNAVNIHYLDDSLFSSIAQLKIMLDKNDGDEEFGEMELF